MHSQGQRADLRGFRLVQRGTAKKPGMNSEIHLKEHVAFQRSEKVFFFFFFTKYIFSSTLY